MIPFVTSAMMAFVIMNSPGYTHSCHLTGNWLTPLTVEYARMQGDVATLLVTTGDGCLCLVVADAKLLQEATIVLSGREFVGAGYREKGENILVNVCPTIDSCLTTGGHNGN
jgi:hypothetical protein